MTCKNPAPLAFANAIRSHQQTVIVWCASFVLSLLPSFVNAAEVTVQMTFYGQPIILQADTRLKQLQNPSVDEMALRRSVDNWTQLPLDRIVTQLQEWRITLALNDWWYSQLARESSKALLGEQKQVATELLTGMLLARSGFDVLYTYKNGEVFLNIYTEETVYEMPQVAEGGRNFVNITFKPGSRYQPQSMYVLGKRLNPQGKAFSFAINYWPKLLENNSEKWVSMNFNGQVYECGLQYNAGLPLLMDNYPLLSEIAYHEAPLSDALRQSLLPWIKNNTRELSPAQTLSFLAAFTRSGFQYKMDNQVFGKSKPLVGDELFYYPYSDCEDRSALFVHLVREVLQAPVIVIAYDDHITTAVDVAGLNGDYVNYKNRRYYFCDPTGPSNSQEIGRVPKGYEQKKFTVLAHFPID